MRRAFQRVLLRRVFQFLLRNLFQFLLLRHVVQFLWLLMQLFLTR